MKGVISKSAIVMAVLFFVSSIFAATPVKDTAADTDTDLYTVIAQNADLGTFTQIVETAQMAQPLQNEGPYTVFALTDSAFDTMDSNTVAELKTDPAAAQDFISEHLVQESLKAADLQTKDKVETLSGDEVAIAVQGDAVTVGGAEVIANDLTAKNGVVHILKADIN